MELRKVYDELNEQLQHLKQQVAALQADPGVTDYDELENRPKVNNITLTGNKKSSDLKIAYSMTEAEYAAASKNAESIYCLQENAAEVTESDDLTSIEWVQSGDDYVATVSYTASNQDVTGVTSVTCDSDTITIESYSLVEGAVVTLISTTDPAEVPDSVEFTFTMSQPIGSTRIVKDGVPFGKSYSRDLLHGSATLAYPASQTADITLSGNIDDYDDIMIVCGWTADNVHGFRVFQTPSDLLMQTSSASSDIDKQFLCAVNSKETQWVRVSKGSGSNKIHCRYNGSVGIYQIYGIKY